MSYVVVTLVLATLFGLDAYEAALAIFIAGLLIHLCRCAKASARFRLGLGSNAADRPAPCVNARRQWVPSWAGILGN